MKVEIENSYNLVLLDYEAERLITNTGIASHTAGTKFYELSNHLGNVLSVISDKRIPIDNDEDGTGTTVLYYTADVVSYSDYYPFGMPMPGRNGAVSGGEYRYGFNGQEKDDEVKGQGNSYDFGARIYDSRLGRWLSVDPLVSVTPFISPYVYCANSSIVLVDENGEIFRIYFEETDANTGKTKIRHVDFDGVKLIQDDGSAYVMGSVAFVDEVIKSYNYIITNKADINGVMKGLATRTEITNIKYTKNPDQMEYDPKSQTIYWNPYSALDVYNKNGVSGLQSAAVGLFHEAVHRYLELTLKVEDPVKYATLQKQHDMNLEPGVLEEEYYIMENYETPAVNALNDSGQKETSREKYGQDATWTTGSTSTNKEKKSVIKDKIKSADKKVANTSEK